MHEAILEHARLFDIPGQAVIATDAAGAILFWNQAAEALYGWTAGEVVGRNVLEVTPAEISRAEAGEIMARLEAGMAWSGEFLVRGKDGAPFTAQVMDAPVRNASGTLIGIVGISRRRPDPVGAGR